MNSSPAHTQSAVPAADSVSGTPDAPARTGYVPGPDTLRAETDFAGTNFANPAFAETAFAETAFADGGSAPFSVAATGAAPSEWRDTTSAAIFGAQSTLAEPARIPLAPPPPLAENALFQSFVLLLAATYAMLLYRNLTDVYALWGMTSIDRAKSSRILQTEGSNYTHFLHAMLALGIPVAGVAAVRLLALALPATLAANVSPHLSAPLAGVAAALLLLVAGVQVAALRIAGEVTLTQPFVGNLLHLKRIYAALAAVAVSPPLLLWVLCTGDSGKWLFYLILCESVILTILYLKESLALFISKKISILHWFLYLCIVEIFPVSLLWLLLVR